jgi:hypothetical protein
LEHNTSGAVGEWGGAWLAASSFRPEPLVTRHRLVALLFTQDPGMTTRGKYSLLVVLSVLLAGEEVQAADRQQNQWCRPVTTRTTVSTVCPS